MGCDLSKYDYGHERDINRIAKHGSSAEVSVLDCVDRSDVNHCLASALAPWKHNRTAFR